jgi:hypothetical protein
MSQGVLLFPVRPRCSHYATDHYASRCAEPAVAALTNPRGKLNPGGWVCWAHGALILGEYAEKLGEQWGAVEILTLTNGGSIDGK